MAATARDEDLVRFLDKMQEESDVRRDQTGIKDAELNFRYARGEQGDVTPPGLSTGGSLQYKFAMNLVGPLMKRKTALLTDTRPQMQVESRAGLKRRGTAESCKNIIAAMWDEQSLEQAFTRQLYNAGVIGSTLCIPVWDKTADYGRGDIRLRFFDPRQVSFDPSVTRAKDLQQGEFLQVLEVVSLGYAQEAYPTRAGDIRPNARWSKYQRPESGERSVWRSMYASMQRAWSADAGTEDSAIPRAELRHTWFKDFPRDRAGKALLGQPRIIRHVVDDGGIVLADDAPFAYGHGQIPGHLFDWDIETEHAWGQSELANLRRIQYTLNRIVGQIVENTILTNRVLVVADTDAVDNRTWAAITAGGNGTYVRKKLGRSFNFTNPAALPPHLISLVNLLIGAIDLVSGINDATRGVRPPGVISGAAISELAQQAQTVVRLQARAFEDWLQRIFQQVVALIFQYYTTNRVVHLIGANMETLQFEFDREKFLKDANGENLPEHAWRDFQFRVLPGSSLASTRVQRGVMAMNLHMAGLLPGAEVLRAAEWPDPDETYKKALAERPQRPDKMKGKAIRVPGTRAGGL